jgi:hypothetical protein
MPITVCPGCKRRLILPEGVIGEKARCPVCQMTFDALPEGGLARPVEKPLTIPDPAAPWRPPEQPEPREEPRPQPWKPARPGLKDDPSPAVAGLKSAGGWLFSLSLASLGWHLLCGCGGVLAGLSHSWMNEFLALLLLLAHLAHLGILMFVVVASRALRGGFHSWLASAGAHAATFEILFALHSLIIVLLMEWRRGEPMIFRIFLIINVVLSLSLFAAGLHAVNVLSRPEARAGFAQDRSGHDEETL